MNISLLLFNIQKLCDKNGIRINKMLQECDLDKNTITHLKNGSIPSVDKVFKIAEYFNVSVDYLLGYTPKTDDEMQEIINFYTNLSPSEREFAFEVAKTVLKTKTEFDKN